ncbi:MAG: alpha/beta fold hydrolase [Planctomycetes bacterium]|nr:alpha/beta fold hydrolase [Planctomycetota bacterium]
MDEKRRSRVWGGPIRRVAVWAAFGVVTLVVLRMTGCVEQLFYQPQAGPTPLPVGFPGAEAIVFTSADGTALHGWFLPAAVETRAAGTRAPTILHLHGNAGNIVSHLWFTEYLPVEGFNLLTFDYRGYGQSDGRARRRSDLIADADAALDAALARDDVDPDRVGMYAQSLGAGIGLNVMAEREEIATAVVVSPFAGWREIAADSVRAPWRDSAGPIARLVAAALIADTHRPVDAIARIDRPVLVIHGGSDSIVPVRHGRLVAESGPATTFVEVQGADHNDIRDIGPEFEIAVIEFLRRHLGE